MRITKVIIKQLFGLKEERLGDADYEITGTNKTGKTSFIDAIRFGITNKSVRDIILRKGAEEGEILIETDTGLKITRKERAGKVGLKNVKDGKTPIRNVEEFLRKLFMDLQLDPVAFISLPPQEQNRLILDLIEFEWDVEWIKKQFGEIVPEIDYNNNILKVLADIQAEKGYYFRTRQALNRDIKSKHAITGEIAVSLPEKYNSAEWEKANLSELYTQIETIREKNRQIEKAVSVVEGQQNKQRGFQADRTIALAVVERDVSSERNRLEKNISDLENQIKAYKKDLEGLEEKKISDIEKVELKHKADLAKYETSIEENKEIAAGKIQDVSELLKEASLVEQMKSHISEYKRMCAYHKEIEKLTGESQRYTDKIEKARMLPAEILEKAKLPLENLSIVDGIPLINGLPVNNLSEGEKMELCVNVAISKKTAFNLLLLDGTEKLGKKNREKLYGLCKEKGVRFVASRTTDDEALIVREL